jgi:hypothetical protein
MGFSACTDVGYRRQQEAELKLIEEETARRVEEAIRKKVNEALNSEEVKKEIEAKVQEGRNKLFHEIAQQLAREKEDALAEARRLEVTMLNCPALISLCIGSCSSVMIHSIKISVSLSR